MPPDTFGRTFIVEHHHAALSLGQEIRLGAVDIVFKDCRVIHTTTSDDFPVGYLQVPYTDCEGRWFKVTTKKDEKYVELTEIEGPSIVPTTPRITLTINSPNGTEIEVGSVITFDDFREFNIYVKDTAFGVRHDPSLKKDVPYRVVAIDHYNMAVEEVEEVGAVKPGEMIGTVIYIPCASGTGQFVIGSQFKFGERDPLNPTHNQVLNGGFKFRSCGVTIKMDVGPITPSDDIYTITKIDGNSRWTVAKEELATSAAPSPSPIDPMICRTSNCLACQNLDVHGYCPKHCYLAMYCKNVHCMMTSGLHSITGLCQKHQVEQDQNAYNQFVASSPNTSTSTTSTDQETHHMNGQVYTGHVVKTKTIQAGEGVHSGVQKSEIVFTTSRPVIAASIGAAKNIILALAARQDSKLDLENPTEVLEVVVVAAS